MNLLRGKTLQEIHKDLKSLPRKEKNKLFHRYVIEGDIVKVRMILNSGVNVDVKNSTGRTALMMAAERGDYEMVKLLLRKGSNINITDKLNNDAFDYALDRIMLEDPILTLLIRYKNKRNI